MAKMKKKYVSVGAPLYMSQFTMIMLILIVMCMLMSTMSKKQDAGFESGDGGGKRKNKNALGITIDAGKFKFGAFGKTKSFSPNPGDTVTSLPQNPHVNTLKGEGGTGNTDLDFKQPEKPVKYFHAKLMEDFPDKSSDLTPALRDDIDRVATAMNIFDFEVVIKVFAKDFEDDGENYNLACQRAGKIMRIFNKTHKVPVSNLSFFAYPKRKFLEIPKEEKPEADKEKTAKEEKPEIHWQDSKEKDQSGKEKESPSAEADKAQSDKENEAAPAKTGEKKQEILFCFRITDES